MHKRKATHPQEMRHQESLAKPVRYDDPSDDFVTPSMAAEASIERLRLRLRQIGQRSVGDAALPEPGKRGPYKPRQPKAAISN